MKLFEKIMRFIRGADRAVTDAICERLDNTAEKLENFARNLDPEAFQESKMRESWEGRPKTDPETAARLAQMPVASLEDAIDQITEGMVKAGFKTEEAADAIRSVLIAGVKPKPLSHLTNNWTQTEVSQMKMLRKQGFTIREIAEKMNRSESSIKYKLYGREKSNGRS